jgi:REP-associated tyrosine transposase
MSNKKRRCEPNLTYHTYSRCADKSNMMRHNHMKNLLLTVIAMAQGKYSFDLISYVIMDNHFHFIIRTVDNGAPISRIMQFIKARFAQRYNKMMNRTGPFWNERYGDTIIEEQEFPEEAFNNINSYIINNPVKANYVNDAKDYRYSCIHFYIDENYISPVKLTFHEYYLRLGSSFRQRAERFLELGRLQLLRAF